MIIGHKATRTCLERGCVRSFHERQKQTKSEIKGLILIRLMQSLHVFNATDEKWSDLRERIATASVSLVQAWFPFSPIPPVAFLGDLNLIFFFLWMDKNSSLCYREYYYCWLSFPSADHIFNFFSLLLMFVYFLCSASKWKKIFIFL